MTIDLKSRASDDLLIGAGELINNNILTTPEEVLSFFEKPWHWEKELKSLHIKVNVE